MSPNPVFQPSLAGGELAPSLYGRVDLARYTTSLKLCRNFISQVYGGVKNRPGTRMVAETKASGKVRLVPFVFNQEQAYVLELGNRYLRAYTDGGQLAGVTNKPNYGTMLLAQTGFAGGVGTYTITASLDTFAAGDVGRKFSIDVRGLYDQHTITAVTDAQHATCTGSINYTGITIAASSKWMFSDNPVGTVIFETSTPWTSAELADLVYTQSADVLTLTHPSHPPQDIRRLSDGTFEVVDTLIVNGPFRAVNVDKAVTVTVTGTVGTVTINASAPIFQAVNVGQLFYVEPTSYGLPWGPGKSVTAGDIRMYDGKYYKAMDTGTTGTIAPTHFDDKASDGAVDWLYLHSGFGIIKITAVGTLVNGRATSATGIAQGILPSGLNIGSPSLLTVTSYEISPGDSTMVRVTTSVNHGFATDEMVSYNATQ